MKVSEFKKAIDNIGLYNDMDLKVTEDRFDFCIEHETRTLATVSKTMICIIDIGYIGFVELPETLRQDLLDVIYKFAGTPLDEREDEKRYIIPLPHLVTTDGEQQYLTHRGGFFANERNENLRQTWKEEHLKYVPEEYRKYAVEVEDEI